MKPSRLLLVIFIHQLVFLFQAKVPAAQVVGEPPTQNQNESDQTNKLEPVPPPNPIPSASYLASDGLVIVIMFDRPVNLTIPIEAAGKKRSVSVAKSNRYYSNRITGLVTRRQDSSSTNQCSASNSVEQQQNDASSRQTTDLVQGVELCAKLLTKKTLKLLNKQKLYNCIWPSRVQFIIQVGKPMDGSTGGPTRITFQRRVLSEWGSSEQSRNEREVSLELVKLPLEQLGVSLGPRLALTGPNQVPPCGQFALSAHLSSPYGTQAGDSVRLSWSVERIGYAGPGASLSVAGLATNGTSRPRVSGGLLAQPSDQQGAELRWRALQSLVAANRGNNLLLDAQLLQLAPQLYEFQVSAHFNTASNALVGATVQTLNASHQVSRIDFEAPIGTLYGSHLLGLQPQVNPSQELVLLADVQVPECASNVKQVGLYWQVSDPRVRFEQTYAPFYLAKQNSLPEQSTVEFRLNLFYGIRVKKYAWAGTLVATGDSVLDARISDGALIVATGQESDSQHLELFGSASEQQDSPATLADDQFAYQWSCFDGKTAQPCSRRVTGQPGRNFLTQGASAANATRYELGALAALAGNQQQPGQPLIDRQRQRQQALRLPLSWLEPEAQLWFGLQRFDKMNPSQKSNTEYTLVSVLPGQAPALQVGPVLLGRARHRASVRNPLTGAVVLPANTPVIIVGRLSPARSIQSFEWRIANYLQPFHWTQRNQTNQQTGQQELYTELHLSPRLQVAHAHHQIQLIACTGDSTTTQVAASLNIDIVQGLTGCRVEAAPSPLSGSLVVSVEFCNIPLGLSPITYQIYVAEAPSLSQEATSNEEDYLSEADESALESRAQPLTMPQLSPVFSLGGLNPGQLISLLNSQRQSVETISNTNNTSGQVPRALRFGARVCDRLQTCRMFYSATLGAAQITHSPPGSGANEPTAEGLSLISGDQASNRSATASELVATMKAAPLASDLLSGGASGGPQAVVRSMEMMIGAARRANLAGNSIAAVSILNGAINLGQRSTQGGSGQQLQPRQQEQVKDLVQQAAKDCLQYGALSLQRQFHYTDSGQTNLVTHAMGRILTLPHGNIELKFKAIRLLTMVTRRSITEQLSLKLNCLADTKAIQSVYESLFGTFSHYSIERSEKVHHKNTTSSHQARSAPPLTGNSSASLNLPPAASVSRKKREEAILAYLKSVRLSFRTLLSAAAIQLALGDEQHFHYNALPAQSNNRRSATNSRVSAEIVSSLMHLTEVPLGRISIDSTSNDELGSVSLKLSNRGIWSKLRNKLSGSQLRCRNESLLLPSMRLVQRATTADPKRRQQVATNCSSLVLAVSTFAGKSPFRSLDDGSRLRVPIVEISVLSPIDGSNVQDLLEADSQQTGDTSEGSLGETQVTFNVPAAAGRESSGADPSYRCYKFDELTNEWSSKGAQVISSEAGADTEVDPSSLRKGDSELVRCSFRGLGAFAAFRGRPGAGEGAMGSSAVVVAAGILGVVIVLSMLSCLVSSSGGGNSSKDGSEKGGDEEEDARHPEQTFRRNGQFNYPM